jgi:predicted phage-related endonuclease
MINETYDWDKELIKMIINTEMEITEIRDGVIVGVEYRCPQD